MKYLIATAMLLLSLNVFAEADNSDAKMLERKTEVLAGIDKRMVALQEHKTCVTAATTGDAMKKCHSTMSDTRQEAHMEHMQNKKERMGERMKKHEDKMKKKADKKSSDSSTN